MKYRSLGRAGFDVSEIAYGVWGMSSWPGSDDRQSAESLRLATELGCNFIDSAWAYGEGKGDTFAGEVLCNHREKRIYVASKIPPLNRKWPGSARSEERRVGKEC